MKKKQILAVIKEPGEAPRVEPLLENSLDALQQVVGGYIETVTFGTDLVIICNEEGLLRRLPFNCEIGGCGFLGTIVAVGTKGEEFASLKAKHIPFVLKMMGGKS